MSCIGWLAILFMLLTSCVQTKKPAETTEPPKPPLAWAFDTVASPSTRSDSAAISSTFQEKMADPFRGTDFDSAYARFERLLPEAKAARALGFLFSQLLGHPQLQPPHYTLEREEQILRLWVSAAVAENDEEIRTHRISALPSLYQNRRGAFTYIGQTTIRPGGRVVLQGYGNDRRRSPNFVIFLQRMVLDSLQRPTRFDSLERQALVPDGRIRYEKQIDSAGLYRILIHTDTYVAQHFFQATWLDAATEADDSTLLVWGGSFRDTVAPPYDVHLWSPTGARKSFQTDSSGLLVLGRPEGVSLSRESPLKVVIKKGNQLAFSQAFFPSSNTWSHRAVLYTDRPLYRPGDWIHYRGVVRHWDGVTMTASSADSVEIEILDSKYQEWLKKKVAVDSWGRFGDSIQTEKEVALGSYTLRLNRILGTLPTSGQAMKRSWHSAYSREHFQIEEYKKPAFRVELTREDSVQLTGRAVKLLVSGAYYFGSPLAQATVRVRWYQQEMGIQSHFFSPSVSPRPPFFYGRGGRSLLSQESFSLDSEGKGQTLYLPKLDHDYTVLTAEVLVTDPSRREVRSEIEFRVAKQNLFLACQLDRHGYQLGDSVRVGVQALDLHGRPQSGTAEIRIKQGQEIVFQESIVMDTAGVGNTIFVPKSHGTFKVEASMRSSEGKRVFREAGFRVSKERRWRWEKVVMKSDKDSYAPGDTARLTIQTGLASANALLSLQASRLFDYRSLRIANNQLQYTFVVNRDLGPTPEVQIRFSGDQRLVTRRHSFRVVDSTRLLKVQIDGKRQLKPGEPFRGRLKITDHQGKALSSAVSLALVDASLLDLASQWFPHLRPQPSSSPFPTGMMRLFPRHQSARVVNQSGGFRPAVLSLLGKGIPQSLRRNSRSARLSSSDAQGSVEASPRGLLGGSDALEKLAVQGKPMGGSGGIDPLQATPRSPRQRKNFRDLGFWAPERQTNAKGEIPLQFSMPDDLTEWKLLVRGADRSQHVVDFVTTLTTRQELMVKLEAPRSFVVGDSAYLTTVVHNEQKHTDTISVRLALADSSMAQLHREGEQKVIVAPGAIQRVDWPVTFLSPGTLQVSTSVQSARGGDGETRSYPVIAHGVYQTDSESKVLTQETETFITHSFPTDSDSASWELHIDFTPTLVYSLFSSLEYLTGYPYGCVEQTMNRFLPNLQVLSLLRSMGIRNDSLERVIPRYTKKGLERLGQLQNGDGSWGWWKEGKSDSRMTALVVAGLYFARKLELDRELSASVEKLIQKSEPRAFELFRQEGLSVSERVGLAHALREAKSSGIDSAQVNALFQERGKLGVNGLAQLVELLRTTQQVKRAEAARDLLWSKAHRTENEIHWKGSRRYSWHGQEVETTAQVLRVLMAEDPSHPDIDKIVLYLSRRKSDGYWISTKTTAAVVFAVGRFLQHSRELNPDFATELFVNGEKLVAQKVTYDSLARWNGQLQVPARLLQRTNQIRVTKMGRGRLYLSTTGRYTLTEKPIRPRKGSISVRRIYTKLSYQQEGKGEEQEWVVKRVPFEGTLRSGDELEVTVEVSSQGEAEHLMVEDFFPGDMEYLRKPETFYRRWCGGWWSGYTHQEVRDDRMVFFVNRISPERVTRFNYLLRAETPGKFVALPARAELMYSPEVSAHSGELEVEISD